MTKTWKIVVAVIIMVIVVGGGIYYLQQAGQPAYRANVGGDMSGTPYSGMSLEDYFKSREQHINEGMMKEDYRGMNNTPEDQGLTVMAKVKIICPDSTPCNTELDILAKDPVRSGNQEFYLSSVGLGRTYYGPFTDDLQRIIDESKTAILTAEPVMDKKLTD